MGERIEEGKQWCGVFVSKCEQKTEAGRIWEMFVSSLRVSGISSRNGLNKISIFVKQIEFIYIK